MKVKNVVFKEIARRVQLAEEYRRLDEDFLKGLPQFRATVENYECMLKAARNHVFRIEGHLSDVRMASMAKSFAHDQLRSEIERELRELSSPLIDAFIMEMRTDLGRLQKSKLVTAKIGGRVKTNAAAKLIRMHAVRHAIEDVEKLRFIANQNEVKALLDALRDGLPSADTLRYPPQLKKRAAKK